MESRDAVLDALKKGKRLTSVITGMQYTLIAGKLHSRHGDKTDWRESGLQFDNPPSWLNLRE
ncbi:hypothetical protein E0765_10425 [Sulfuricurvum sp. IAE1]|jgi:hypothetical protein|uniref:hypothetical protein n=1 Tax=Sulfuricurvum sp. IAE1 TaxID=2546102 RepID=UPI001052BD87|nr:hypothetical protein [Sulfuricurvum sp. IAE1]MDX9966140.1 hypothetical protein [Sulfuricurvum sp.]TDA62988.1 hypothetical protein E0765_10425 [Sulfuricurvum sp. IAE1]